MTENIDKLSIYVPIGKQEKQPIERLVKLAKQHDRSVNYLVVEAILKYVEREEKK
jgi:predicted DNA-binding protein